MPTYSEIVEQVRQLDGDSKNDLLQLLHAWVIEERREEILRSAAAGRAEHGEGRAQCGGVDALMSDLNAEG